jgi:hypothetical protein
MLFLTSGAGALADTPAGMTAAGDTPAPDEPKALPQTNIFSSVKQSLRMGFDHEAVRGHFDLGSPPNSRRYYCLVDTRTGSREPNGVLGQPAPLPDGTTGLKIDSVSLYACKDAEQQGMLVTAGYILHTPAAHPAAPAPAAVQTQAPAPQAQMPAQQVQPPAQVQISAQPPKFAPTQPQTEAPPAAAPGMPLGKIDVAGLKLGMSLDEARAVLKSKKLREYNEATETLSYLDPAKGSMRQIPKGQFVNIAASWTPAAGDSSEADGEAFEVMFTPVPGKERVVAIVHTVGYSAANAIHESALENGLVEKYGGFAASSNLPQAPTWRFQSGGYVQVGDACNRRGLFGGLGGLSGTRQSRENFALKETAEELRYQIDHCGVVIVTEDHFTANGGALRADRLVTRFTVTAYSPEIASEGAESAAQLIQAVRGVSSQGDASRTRDRTAPNL